MIAAIVLAAGLSRRMGRPKLLLPWGGAIVIGQVVDVLLDAGASPVVVVTGGTHKQVEQALQGKPVRLAFNPRYAEDEMVRSLQIGLAELSDQVEATLVVLGDQPQIEIQVVQALMLDYQTSRALLVIPSYQMRRGHPWVVDRKLWPALMTLHLPDTLRDFVSAHASQIRYLNVERASVLQDLDTPEDYQRYAPPPRKIAN
jgi:molybdenum cofactor cytidylyltransferase